MNFIGEMQYYVWIENSDIFISDGVTCISLSFMYYEIYLDCDAATSINSHPLGCC